MVQGEEVLDEGMAAEARTSGPTASTTKQDIIGTRTLGLQMPPCSCGKERGEDGGEGEGEA